jgi:hypothetical protein
MKKPLAMSAQQLMAHIRKNLDGKFCTVHHDGSVRVIKVPLDYVPKYDARDAAPKKLSLEPKTRRQMKKWTEAESKHVVDLRLIHKLKIDDICAAVGRQYHSVQAHLERCGAQRPRSYILPEVTIEMICARAGAGESVSELAIEFEVPRSSLAENLKRYMMWSANGKPSTTIKPHGDA